VEKIGIKPWITRMGSMAQCRGRTLKPRSDHVIGSW
jgi:hypothetical protein